MLLSLKDVADNDLSDQDELEFNSDDEEDELTLSFNDVEVYAALTSIIMSIPLGYLGAFYSLKFVYYIC